MNAQAPPQELTPSPQHHSDSLCDRCRSIDFDTILSQQHRRIVEVVTLERVSPSDCALCRLFAQYCGGGDWGGGILYSMPWNPHDEPLKDLPTTVRDSIVVTQKLGFRYLWVDKYCIRQDDEQDKSRQIRLMAKIYGSAQLTIVAVAGSDPSYGLPGVSRSRRPCQPHVRVRNRTITWAFSLKSVQDDILSSVWSTRGWTYQEAFLSTRLLVFTDKQIYFQCKDSSFYEAFNIPMWEDSEKPRIFRGVESLEIGVRIHEYTRRNLGNEADILNAFQGFFDLFHENYNHFNNIWGIPITEKSFQHMPAKLLDRFLAGICWKLEMPGNRRHGFPSWSWVGWKGVVNKRCDFGAEPATISNGIGILASFESPDGTRTEWSQLEPTLGADGSQDHLRILVLDCFSFPLQLEEVHGEGDADGPTSDAKTRFRVTGDVVGHFVPLFKRLSWGPDQSRQGRILGVPLDIRSFWEREEGPELFILVFHKKFEFWERVGHFEWSNPEGKINLRAFSNTVRTTRTVLRIA
ncbi:hypothetical protein BHE90_014977 [Fusarium euwallaceae]|uniref:Heterokaryon incompatibility domain-containing protein n=1 Tax=Fusarium euwallaceae TaxID=1147111 RepID=A0A430L4F4_9HYPO|nr:hypothetical protein BHE90_014977 [Fusarium euwallaceae]